MSFYHDRTFWAQPEKKWAVRMLEADHFRVYQQDPFVQGLKEINLSSSFSTDNFKSQYWPSLITAIKHENPYVRTLTLDLLIDEDKDEITSELWNLFQDPFPLIRMILVKRFKPQNRNRFYQELFLIATNDNNPRVRNEAISRIRRDFSDLLNYHFENFNELEKIHLLDLMDFNTAADRKLLQSEIAKENEISFIVMHGLKKTLVDQSFSKDFYYDFLNSPLLKNLEVIEIESLKDFTDYEFYIDYFSDAPEYNDLKRFTESLLINSNVNKEDKIHLLEKIMPNHRDLSENEAKEILYMIFDQLDPTENFPIYLEPLIKRLSDYEKMDLFLIWINQDAFIVNESWVKGIKENYSICLYNYLSLELLKTNLSQDTFRVYISLLNEDERFSLGDFTMIIMEKRDRDIIDNHTLVQLFDIIEECCHHKFLALKESWENINYEQLENLEQFLS